MRSLGRRVLRRGLLVRRLLGEKEEQGGKEELRGGKMWGLGIEKFAGREMVGGKWGEDRFCVFVSWLWVSDLGYGTLFILNGEWS